MINPRLVCVAACLVIMSSTPLRALEQVGKVVTLNDNDMRICKQGGGCMIVTNRWIEGTVSDAVDLAIQATVRIERAKACSSGRGNDRV